MKPSQLVSLIQSRHEAEIRRALLVEAAPGVGKTEIAYQVSKILKIGFMAIHAPLLVAEDYGFPVVSKDKMNVDFVVSSSKFPLEGSDCPEFGIFLIDELPQADTAGQKILANLVQEREIHGKKLKAGWTIVCTGNRQKDRAGANRILGHLGNKITRVELDVSLDDWTQWALQNDVNPEVVAFIRFRPALLSNFDPQQEINATPRAWVHGVSACLGAIPKELEFECFKGDVGEGPAAEFLAFLKIYRNMPNPDAILLDPKKAKLPTDPATLYALCGALSHRATPQNFGRALTYVRRMDPEFSVLFVKDAGAKNGDVFTTKDYIDWASKEGADLLT